jgi:hypothetical protein
MFRSLLQLYVRKKDGVVTVRPVSDRKSVWSSALKKEFPDLAMIAEKLMTMHVTSCASERNLSKFGRLYDKLRGRLLVKKAEKIVFVSQNRAFNVKGNDLPDEEVLISDLEGDISSSNVDAIAIEESE